MVMLFSPLNLVRRFLWLIESTFKHDAVCSVKYKINCDGCKQNHKAFIIAFDQDAD